MPNKQPANPSPAAPVPGFQTEFHDALDALHQRLCREGMLALELLEAAISAFKKCDRSAAKALRARDTEVDEEEVHIEEETVRLIALHQPVARDLRRLMLIIKSNADIERIADHAMGLCKSVLYLDADENPTWPTALLDMADRVIPRSHDALRALQAIDADAAQKLISEDATLDSLARRAFEEIEHSEACGRITNRAALLAFRASRELERISDLVGAICEDIVYTRTGRIIRHAKRLNPPAKPA
ncbi:MAG: phosphate signaling complex protein PhoU [Phycisphaerales bacterium]